MISFLGLCVVGLFFYGLHKIQFYWVDKAADDLRREESEASLDRKLAIFDEMQKAQTNGQEYRPPRNYSD
ncbi:MAG: hypothetical protein HC843_10510 [Sphingomonadales bacterium]|nr:hypothetical protein [Sphingomonadales bacterium]